MKFLVTLLLLTANVSLAEIVIPEASGITKVGSEIIIAGDEEPKALWIEKAGKIQKIPVSGGSWDDMEGLATVDENFFFGITSHSLTKKGKQKPEREQLFLFSKESNKISVISSWSLRSDALSFLEKEVGKEIDMNIARTASPDSGGFNIEGLACKNNNLFLGLRSPVTKSGKAIILKLNVTANKSQFSEVILVDLKGQGIRSLDFNGNDLLILSGSTNDISTGFGVHSLTMKTGTLKDLKIKGFDSLIRPEGMTLVDDTYIFVQDFEQGENQDVIVKLKN